jgi:hypothetical protein
VTTGGNCTAQGPCYYHEICPTLKACGAHSVIEPAAFMGGQVAKARSIAYCDDGSTPTLKSAPSGGNTVPDVVDGKCQTLTSRMRTGGQRADDFDGMRLTGFDAYQHHNWRQSETLGTLTAYGGGYKGRYAAGYYGGS